MHKLIYTSPAKHWREALPIGNGHTAVMVYGGRKKETLCFNNSTLWSGYPKDQNDAGSLEALPQVRQLIFEGKTHEADKLAMEKMCGGYSESFLPLASVKLEISGGEGRSYRRELDLSTGVLTVENAGIEREIFASFPDKLVCMRLKSEKPFEVKVSACSDLHFSAETDSGLNLSGNAPDYVAPNYVRGEKHPVVYSEGKGMAYALRIEAESNGKLISGDKAFTVFDATDVKLYFATATGFISFDQMPDTDTGKALAQCKDMLSARKNYDEMKDSHTADFRSLSERSCIRLGNDTDMPADELLRTAKRRGVSPELCELFYNFGKYLTISGSRPGGQPMNLQGQWNDNLRPPWSSNYTVNINTEMNYWGSSRAGLDECNEPLLDMVYEVMKNGRKTAEANYGCAGFAANHNIDIWRKTSPVKGNCCYSLEPLCGIWLANEIYAKYKNGGFQGDAQRVKVLEITTEAARFTADYLVLHDGRYVICPSPSAENRFENGGEKCALDYASAFDMGIVKQAFANYLEIGADAALTEKVKAMQPELYDFRQGRTGILEYHKDYEMPERGHRHFSPLYAFFPGTVIEYYKNPEQREWVRTLFLDRISHSKQYIGWSAAWGICLAARLHDSKNAEMIINRFLCHAVFKNLFCMHPPKLFQIDGNLGFVAAVHEMLLYEEDGIIELLPALPSCMKYGRAERLLVNGADVSFEWKNGKVISISSDRPVTVADCNLSEQVKTDSNVRLTAAFK